MWSSGNLLVWTCGVKRREVRGRGAFVMSEARKSVSVSFSMEACGATLTHSGMSLLLFP